MEYLNFEKSGIMFLGLPLIERIFSYFVLTVWAFEMIVFNIVLITKYKYE